MTQQLHKTVRDKTTTILEELDSICNTNPVFQEITNFLYTFGETDNSGPDDFVGKEINNMIYSWGKITVISNNGFDATAAQSLIYFFKTRLLCEKGFNCYQGYRGKFSFNFDDDYHLYHNPAIFLEAAKANATFENNQINPNQSNRLKVDGSAVIKLMNAEK